MFSKFGFRPRTESSHGDAEIAGKAESPAPAASTSRDDDAALQPVDADLTEAPERHHQADVEQHPSTDGHGSNQAAQNADPTAADCAPLEADDQSDHVRAGDGVDARLLELTQVHAQHAADSASPEDDTSSTDPADEAADVRQTTGVETPASTEDPAAWGNPPEALANHTAMPGLSARRRRRGRALAKGEPAAAKRFTGQQRLLLLDTWRRSGLSAGDFATLVGLSKHTLYQWKKRFEQQGPAALAEQPRGRKGGSQLPELTRRTILMLKEAHPEWGCERISDMLLRGPALPASASAVARVLHQAGYQPVDSPTRAHPDKVRRFERARANQLWQTDLFSFVLKRHNRRLHLVAFLDDHSRFVVSFGLHATASTALVLEALEAGIASYGPPEEILTDNGPQYVTWRGKSQFTKQVEKRGIRQIVARPRRPQTLGKIERFWGTLWREFLETAVFADLADARTRVGLFVDYYNLQRVHRGIDGLVPADRFFGASSEVLRTLKERVAANALELARHGRPRRPFYVTGQVDGQPFSVHAEGQRLILRRADGQREEVTLDPGGQGQHGQGQDPQKQDPAPELPVPLCPQGAPPVPEGEPATEPPRAPGDSPLDAATQSLDAATEPERSAEDEDAEPQGPKGGEA